MYVPLCHLQSSRNGPKFKKNCVMSSSTSVVLIISTTFAILVIFFTSFYGGAVNTEENRKIAEDNYPDSLFERIVATHFGDELRRMRDDLIERKNKGEGIIQRHFNAWTTLSNWEWCTYESVDEQERVTPGLPSPTGSGARTNRWMKREGVTC